jgi:hypothetical protein
VGERQHPNNIQRREVPEEALQALAREVSREVGLAQDPNDTALLQNDKARAELFKKLAVLNVGLLTGIVATVAFLPEPRHIWWLSLSVGDERPKYLAGSPWSLVRNKSRWAGRRATPLATLLRDIDARHGPIVRRGAGRLRRVRAAQPGPVVLGTRAEKSLYLRPDA